MRLLFAGVRALLIGCSLTLVVGCATSSQSGVTYGFYVNIINLTVTTPTPLNTDYQVLCPKGQSVLAGGFNLNGPTALADWGEAHPPLSDAVDTNGLYRPIPELLRVDASLPLPGLNGWTIHVAGQAYPGASRSITVYAYCVAGLSTAPTLVSGPNTTSSATGRMSSRALCPAGTIVTGGGYSAGLYQFGGGHNAYLPIYTSIPDTSTSWLVAPGLLTPGFVQPLIASFFAEAVCASAKQFVLVGKGNGGNGYSQIPIRTLDPQQPQDAQTAQYTQAVSSAHVALDGEDTAYAFHLTASNACPAGSFLLPPGFDLLNLSPSPVWIAIYEWTRPGSIAASLPGVPTSVSAGQRRDSTTRHSFPQASSISAA